VPSVTVAKVALALIGAALFLYAAQTGNENLRWAGIGVVAVAFLLRFVKPRGNRTREGDDA
jgi:hydrogenase/urease accessory protein HupE